MKKDIATKYTEANSYVASELKNLKAAAALNKKKKYRNNSPYIFTIALILVLILALFPIGTYCSTHNTTLSGADGSADLMSSPSAADSNVELGTTVLSNIQQEAIPLSSGRPEAAGSKVQGSEVQPEKTAQSDARHDTAGQLQTYFKAFELTPASGHATCYPFISIDKLGSGSKVLLNMAVLSFVLIVTILLVATTVAFLYRQLRRQ